jgi:anti-anti-sigma factor
VLHTSSRPASTEADLLSVAVVPASFGRLVLEVVGEVDPFTAPLLELCLDSQAVRPGLRELIVDMQGVTFLGAAGMSALAQAHQRCRERGASLVVRSGPALVLRSLQLAGLGDLVAVDPARARSASRTPARQLPRPRRAPTRRPPRRSACSASQLSTP